MAAAEGTMFFYLFLFIFIYAFFLYSAGGLWQQQRAAAQS
jgi:hypothetical protein